ncbi:MAG TPA: hypothetical protein VKU00_09450 [Chthonomonadaceae bacterium]|nr:hypothetical protein [Chthonomonadaceae bacterium]
MIDPPGNQGHLTQEEADAYLQRSLPSQMRWNLDQHLSTCQECRRRVRLDAVETQATAFLESDLTSLQPEEEAHLSYEEMEAYLENRADPLLREIVAEHSALCALCATELRELQAFRLLVLEEASSASEEQSALHDTTGPVQVTGGRALLTGVRSLSRTVLSRIEELIAEGFVKPFQSLQNRLELLKRATAPTLVRSQGQDVPIPLSPASTAIRSAAPIFQWTPVQGANAYQMVIATLDKQGERTLLWQGMANMENAMPLPSTLSLEPGKAYLWYVKARVGKEERPSPFAGFVLLTSAAQQEVAQEERTLEASALALACLYERYGLYEEALSQAERLLSLNPTHPQVLKMHQHLRIMLAPPLSSL